MVANYEAVRPISRIAGADYSDGSAQYLFVKEQTNTTSVPGPDKGDAFGYAGTSNVSIDPGAVLVNNSAGGHCLGVCAGKAKAGQPLEIHIGGRSLVKVGSGGLTAGDKVASDGSGQAVTASGSNLVLGIADGTYVQGDIAGVYVDQAGPVT